MTVISLGSAGDARMYLAAGRIDIAAMAQVDRSRGRAQQLRFQERKPDNISTYSRAYYRRWWEGCFRFKMPGEFESFRATIPHFPVRRLVPLAVATVLGIKLAFPTFAEAAAGQLMMVAIFATEPVFHIKEDIDRINRRSRCAKQRQLLDVDRNMVGIQSTIVCDDTDRPDYRSTVVEPALAAAFAPAVVSLEGEFHAGPATLWGVNLKGWAAGAAGMIAGNASRGGSSPLETAVKNASGTPGKLGFRQKLKSGLQTAAYTVRLPAAMDRDLFVLENTPCARGAPDSEFGAPVAGGLCFFVLFDKVNPTSASSAERCVVAASYRRQVLVTGPNTSADDLDDAQAHNEEVIERAGRCLLSTSSTDGELRHNQQELVRIAKKYPFNPRGAKSDGAADPAKRLQGRLPGANYILADQFKIEKIADNVDPVRLTLSSSIQQAAVHGFEAVLKSVGPRVGNLCVTHCNNPETQVDAAVAIAEIKSGDIKIVAGIANKSGLIDGRMRLVPDQGYEPMAPTRAVGSLNKAWLAPLLARSGTTQLCNGYFHGVRNSGKAGDTGVLDCALPGAMMPVSFVYAHSKNLPFLAFASALGPDTLRKYSTQMGLTIKDQLDGDALLKGFVLGSDIVATPAVMMRNFSALYLGGFAEKPFATMPGVIIGAERRAPLDLGELGFDRKTLKNAAQLLKAPLYHPTGGTLTTLAPVLSRLGCDQAIGKTGTPESVPPAGDKGNRDKLLLAAFRCGARQFVVFGMLGAPNIATSIGSVTTADVVHLIEPVLSAILKGKGNAYATR